VPVATGPWTHNFREIVDGMRSADAICMVTPDDVAESLTKLLGGDRDVCEMGKRGRAVFEAQSGATERTADSLLKLLRRSVA